MKKLYKRVAENLNKDLNIRKEDVFISLVGVAKENWSFGNGEAQYASKWFIQNCDPRVVSNGININ